MLHFIITVPWPNSIQVWGPHCILRMCTLARNLRVVGATVEEGQQGWAQAECTVTEQCSRKGIFLKMLPVIIHVLDSPGKRILGLAANTWEVKKVRLRLTSSPVSVWNPRPRANL